MTSSFEAAGYSFGVLSESVSTLFELSLTSLSEAGHWPASLAAALLHYCLFAVGTFN